MKTRLNGVVWTVVFSSCLLYVHDFMVVDVPYIVQEHFSIVERVADAPLRNRVLLPYLVDLISHWSPLPTDQSITVCYIAVGCLALVVFLVGIYTFLARIRDEKRALCGLFVTTLAVAVAHIRPFVVPYSLIEAALFVWGLEWLRTCYSRWSLSSLR